MNYCTIFDKNYLLKAMTMGRSLEKNSNEEVNLYCLCLDDEAYSQISTITLDNVNIHAYSVTELERKFVGIRRARTLPVGEYGNQHAAFCWAMTPWFINFLLRNVLTKVMYVDSDIYFYKSPELISYDCIGYDVGLHTHRFSSFDIRKQNVGKYNVGVVFFRSSKMGLKISTQWKD